MRYIINKDIDFTNLNGEKVMINLEKGLYYGINKIGSEILDLINLEKTTKEIVEILISKYEINTEECLKEVEGFLIRLEEHELIENI